MALEKESFTSRWSRRKQQVAEEAFETVLEMVSTDPKAAKSIAHLIKKDFHGLYKEVVALSTSEKDQGNTPSCCGGN